VIFKVGLLGASGRMGQEIASLLADGFTLGADAFVLADGITRSGRLQSLEGMPLRTFGEESREPVHVWIDFSRPEGTMALLEETDRPVVIGTTGFTPAQMETIEAFARKSPVLLCPNTSVGMNLLNAMLAQTATLASKDFAVVLEEDHHKLKQDAPSGSAKRLLESLTQAGFENPTVHVTRAGSIVGTHRIRFIADGEELVLEHRVTDRRIFAKGALHGAQFLLHRKEPRVYRIEEMK
jgi:4-hydroxy-tetrahydrodipicolinate reductase